MAKSKNLFTADDFKKDGGKKKSTLWIIIAAIIIIAVVAVLLLTKKDKAAESVAAEPAPVEQVVNTPAENTQPAEEAVSAPVEEAPATQETPKAEEVKAQPAPVKQESAKPAQPALSSQNTGDIAVLNGKTLEEKANIIISGAFGNNPDRKRALGDAYQEIQEKVNEMYRNGEVK